MITTIQHSEVRPFILESHDVVLLDFYSQKCTPCRALAPVLEELSQEFQEKVRFFQFDVASDDYKTASEFGVRSVPTLMIFRSGKVVARRTGITSQSELRKWIEENGKGTDRN